MKAKKTLALVTLGALTISLMTGCGGRGENMIDPNNPGFNDPGYNTPGNNNPGYNNPGYNDPGYNNPGYGTGLPVQLTATETSRKTKRGGFLYLKTYLVSVTYQVINPSQQPVQGMLKVNFTKGTESAGTQEHSISLAPGGTQTFTVSAPEKTTDATAYAESSQNGGGTNWGSTPGNSWGGTPGTGNTWGY